MKRKFIILTVAVSLLLVCVVGGTLAWIIAHSNEVENTFTIGNVQITLEESTGVNYNLTPGTTIQKDPTVTVKAGSDACWLFVKLEKSADFDTYMSYLASDGWNALAGQDGVYYRQVSATAKDTSFSVLRYNHILVSENVTEEQLENLAANPTLSVTAYAIQQNGFSTAELAWNELNS